MNDLQQLTWDDMAWEQVNPNMKRKLINGASVTVSRIKMKDGFVVPMHSHINEQVTQVLSGQIRFVLGENREREVVLNAGDVLVIPANLPHEATMVGDVYETDTFTPRREDWIDGSDSYLRR